MPSQSFGRSGLIDEWSNNPLTLFVNGPRRFRATKALMILPGSRIRQLTEYLPARSVELMPVLPAAQGPGGCPI